MVTTVTDTLAAAGRFCRWPPLQCPINFWSAHHPDLLDRRTPVQETCMRSWPPYDPADDDIDPELLAAEVDRLIAMAGLSAGAYTAPAAIQAELDALELIRSGHRRARRATTALWIVIGGFVAWTWLYDWPLPLLPAVVLAVFTWQLMCAQNVYPGRGRELDADIAYARERLRRTPEGEGR